MTTKRRAKRTKIVACSQVKRLKKSIPFLPDEIIFEILSWLPVEFLLGIMRYVCKKWAHIIRNPQFVETHVQRSKPGIIIKNCIRPHVSRFLEFKENGDFEITTLRPHFPAIIRSTCGGVLLFDEPSKYSSGNPNPNYFYAAVYVANPNIMHVVKVPPLPIPYCQPTFVIARVPNSGEFKVVCGYVDRVKGACWYIITVGIDNSWREMGEMGSQFKKAVIFAMDAVSIGQLVYWSGVNMRGNTYCEIMVSDIVKESVYPLRIPRKLQMLPNFLRIGDYLALISRSECIFKIYVLKDVHLGLWEFYRKMDLSSLNITLGAEFVGCIGQELIFVGRSACAKVMQVLSYSTRTQQVRWLANSFHWNDLLKPHLNSLVSCSQVRL